MKFQGLRVMIAAVAMMVSGVAVGATTNVNNNNNEVAAATVAKKNTISFAGVTVPVVKGNTKVTTAPKGNVAQTWGGQTNLSVRDNQSTHIIGHNTSTFGNIVKLKVGSPVVVRDALGMTKTYHVTRVANVNDRGILQGTKQSVYKQIVSAKQGEQVVMQTCLSQTMNRIVWAR